MTEQPRQSLPLPTRDELIVNEKILMQCQHADTRVHQDRRGYWETYCPGCDRSMPAQEPYGSRIRFTDTEIGELWMREQLRPASNPINCAQIGYAMGAQGWTVRFLEFDGKTVCEMEKGEERFRSVQHGTRAAATVEVAAKIARGKFPR